MPNWVAFFICLMSSHIIGDFLLQTDWMVRNKNKTSVIVFHAIKHGILAYVLCMQWHLWLLSIILAVTHRVIDLIRKTTWKQFLLDQSLHLVVMVLMLCLLPFKNFMPPFGSGAYYLKSLTLISALILLFQTAGLVIGQVMGPIAKKKHLQIEGLKNGGLRIGQLERFLIFLLILFQMSFGIGFLIAGKSILRFGEAKDDKKLAEYVLIGTFLSFSVALVIGVMTRKLLEQL
jgi:hypothetical protein